MPPPPATFVVGISGLSSSGKTTLSRLLRCIFPSSFILHQDDFFWPDKDIPVREDGIQDWDCVDAINWAHMSSVLEHIRTHGAPPEDLKSWQDESPIGGETDGLVEAGFMERMKTKVKESELDEDVRIAILDGFLMLHQDSIVEDKMDAKMLLRVPYETAKQRREARTGYVTIDGFWADPPGYFDKIVWPNYCQDHKHLFIDGDVESKIKPEVEEQRRIHTPQSLNISAKDTLEWAVDVLIQELKSRKQIAAAL